MIFICPNKATIYKFYIQAISELKGLPVIFLVLIMNGLVWETDFQRLF